MLQTRVIVRSDLVTLMLLGLAGGELVGIGQGAGESGGSPAPAASDPSPAFLPKDGPTEADYPALHNLLKVTERIYSGAEPHGEAAFSELAKLGVKTVVSVDGARPDVETAKKYGLSYVHIPIQYSGVPDDAAKALARAAAEAEGPLYVHCHHGKHRGPAAAAVACVASGAADGRRALAILKKAGTSENYPGLWRDVEAFEKPGPDEELPELVDVAEVDSMTAAMAKIDRANDNLDLFRAARWETRSDHPDLAAIQEARKIREGFDAAVKTAGEGTDERLKTWLGESHSAAAALESALQAADKPQATKHFATLEKACKTCHAEYRN